MSPQAPKRDSCFGTTKHRNRYLCLFSSSFRFCLDRLSGDGYSCNQGGGVANGYRTALCCALGILFLAQVGRCDCVSVNLEDLEWLASLNEDRAAGSEANHANILVGSDEAGGFYGMEWASPEPTDLTLMGFEAIPVSGAEEIVLTMSSSETMRLLIRLTVEGEYCSQTWQDARLARPIEVGTDIACYRFRLDEFATNMGNVCQQGLRSDALDRVSSLVIFPSALLGELRIHSVTFRTEGGEPCGCLLAETAAADPLANTSSDAPIAQGEATGHVQCKPCASTQDLDPSRWGPTSMAYCSPDLESMWREFAVTAEVNALQNGSFEIPTIAQAVSEGSEGKLGSAVWNVGASEWDHSEGLGFCRFMVADGEQCLFWDDPVDAWLAQTVSWEELGASMGDTVALTFWCQVAQLDGAKASGKRIEFEAELLSGNRVVDSLQLNAQTDPALFRLSFQVTDEDLGLPITVRFRADGNCGWSGSEEVQSVFLDDVVLGVESFRLPLRARGVCSPDADPLPGRNVIVKFPDPNYYMLFDPPHARYYYVAGAYGFANEAADTIADGQYFEVCADRNQRIWIEHASPARVVIHVRGALVHLASGEIAHADRANSSPYGNGDWADTWYYVYPNGISVRHVVVHTGYAAGASSFWSPEAPASFNTQETQIHGLLPGHQPMDDIDIEAVTLARLDETYKRISFDEYPREEDLYPGATLQIVNVLDPYKPFTIVPEGNTEIMPYWGPQTDQVNLYSTKLIAWPRVPVFEEGYMTAITHVINRSWFRQTGTTLEQIYLMGLSATPEEADRVAELVQLARSWQYAPDAAVIEGDVSFDGYRDEEKAYHFSLEVLEDDPLGIRFSASTEDPLVDPCLVIHGWAQDIPFQLSIGDLTLDPGVDYCYGFEHQPEGRTALVVWLRVTSSTPTEIQIRPDP